MEVYSERVLHTARTIPVYRSVKFRYQSILPIRTGITQYEQDVSCFKCFTQLDPHARFNYDLIRTVRQARSAILTQMNPLVHSAKIT
jgi:hypothetical protein